MSADDERLFGELRATLAAVDPVPEPVTASARASLGYRRPDAQLAELVADSALAPGVVRSPYAPRLLTFTAPGLVVEVEVATSDDRRELVGHLAPSRASEIEIRWPGGEVATRADLTGHFAASGVPSGPISMVCRAPDGAAVTTSWTSI